MSEKTKKSGKKKYYDNVSVGNRTKQTVHLTTQHDKPRMVEQLIKNSSNKQLVVITKSKRRADELSLYLNAKNIKARAIHGNHRTDEHEAAAKMFNTCELNILITTDMILKTLGLPDIQTIISYDVPTQYEDYFNRLILIDGAGESISLVSPDEKGFLSIIEMRMKMQIPEKEVEEFVAALSSEESDAAHAVKEKKKKPRHRSQSVKKVTKKRED